MNGFFITGTDTDIGKTALSALLLAELRQRGLNAAPMKPAQTGCGNTAKGLGQQALGNRDTPSSLPPQASYLSVPDLDVSLRIAGLEATTEEYALMSPYRFEPACSPHLAAERANTEIDIAEIVIAARALSRSYDLILAEGAGGIMVPLNRRELMLDLMQALKWPVILAARPGLGTINHTLLSIRALRSDGLDIAGVVIVNSNNTPNDFIEQDNLKTIEQFGNVPLLGNIPYIPHLETATYTDLPAPITREMKKIANQLTN